MLVVLMTGATVDVMAEGTLTATDVVINKIPQDAKDEDDNLVVVAGTAVVKSVSGRVVTLTVTPKSGTDYQINEKMITVEPMVDPAAAPRRSSIVANTITVSHASGNDYQFTLPAQYSKANVTVRFFKPADNTVTQIFSLEDLKNGDKYEIEYNKKYEIVSDINAAGFTGFTIVGDDNTGAFEGTLTAQAKADGTFPVIMNLSKPLFTTVTGATISNIMLQQVSISQAGYVGAIACTANGTTRIYNCGILPTTADHSSTGRSTVTSTDSHCGSLVGYLDGYARVINCFSYANVSASSNAGGLVGNNTTATMQGNNQTNFNNNVKTMVVNCMFYGDITSGATKRPVYGGTAIVNNAADKVNNYNYFCEEEASYDDDYNNISNYNYSWPVAIKHLTRFEVYRNILNSNRRLCTWWVQGTYNKDQAAPSDADVESVGIAKWVLDRTIAPYPILKKWGKYYSTFDIDPNYVWNPKTMSNVARSIANAWEGKSEGTLSVTINGGSNNSGASASRNITITDVDTLGYDYCAKKIQLPYYNEVFGNPNGDTWAKKYANNYTSKVVTGWKVTAVDKPGSNSFTADWESGYNFADRDCTEKDLFSKSGRVFAQGGYYYVPNGVKSITIEAYWGDAVYLCNDQRQLDRVNNANSGFYDSGQLPEQVGGISTNPAVKTSLSSAVGTLSVKSSGTVYDQAIVLVGNYQQNNYQADIQLAGNQYATAAKPFTIMSADFDFDNEPDFCFQAGMKDGGRVNVHPIRFDFLMVPDLTMAVRTSNTYYGMRIFVPQGHFEITETSYMYTTQFEYDKRSDNNKYDKHEAPMILNGGEHMQIVSTENFADATSGETATKRVDRTSYFLMGGNVYMKAFTPGCHTKRRTSTRHCAVNVIGGEFPEFYLSGMFNANFFNITDNPHAYLDGGKFGIVAGAGMESVGAKGETDGGNVTFKINHSWIREFYGGGINATRPVTGNISTTCDNSVIHKYCGGPKLGDMSNTKTITNIINNTVFDEYYGGGNGGTNLFRENQYDGYNIPAPSKDETDLWTNDSKGKFNSFTPLKYVANKGYHAEFEFELLPMPQGNTNTVPRTYLYYASFSKTTVAPITNTITDCTFKGNYYGGGNLGAVGGDVSSTLQGHTVVRGSVFGAGFSASIPSFPVHDKSTKIFPYRDYAGFIHEGSLDYKKYTTAAGEHAVGDTIYYTWINDVPDSWNISPKPSTSNPTFEYPSGSGNWYCYTTESLDNLGAVTGDVSLTIEGTTSVGGSIYGGGEESGVDGSTEVTVKGGTIGTEGNGGADYGNVYGGGKGKNDNVTAGLVKGTTTVTISGTPTIYHNVYGGGAYGSVGDFIYDNTTGLPTARKENTTGGVCTVTITGGTIGTNGHENGMVFGSSRGDVGQPGGITDKQAWVHSTQVTIGDAALETGPTIKGSVYGGGENGHTFTDAVVDIVKGTIGITDSEDPDGGARYPYRGNVYGGGCGTDTYTVKENAGTENEKTKTYFNRLAGIVEGNTEVNITGGHVVHNVYGGGAMGSVGVFTREASTDIHVPGKITGVTSGGKCTVTVSGGTVGNTGAKMINETGGPDDFGHVFGGARGQVHDLADYPNLERVVYVDNTDVTISGGLVTGSVYGGSESGHVRENTVVKIQGGQIGCGEGAEGAYTTWNSSVKSTAHWTYEANGHPYDQYAGTTGYNAEGGATTATDGHTFYGNVFGGGSGYYPYAPGKWLRSAGQVGGTATVTISDGQILNNVYGGCEMADVEGAVTVTMTGGTVGVPRTKEQIEALPTIGHIYGAGMGDKRIFFNTSTNVAQTTVNVTGGTVYGSVYGGGEDGHVLANATTTISQAENKTTVIGCDGTSGFDGNVFGGGQGSVTAKTAGVVAGDVVVNIEGGTMKGSVYGGGRLASVGTYFAMADNENYGKMQADVADDPATTEVNEAKSHGHIIVNLNGGIIHQNVYGGCMGTTDAGDESEDYGVSKTVEVNLNKQQCEGKDADNIGTATGCVVRGDIFGCNNTNASPQQTVTVHVYGTQNAAKNDIATKFFKATADLDDMTTLSSLKASIAALNSSTETPTEKEAQYNAQKAIYDNANSTAEQKQAALAEMKAIVLLAVADELGINTDAYTNATNENKQTALDNIKKAINESKYDVHAVYGGGNLAAYKPIGPNPTTTSDDGKNTTYSTNVIIDGCGLTSIRYAYGGGNAASTPATSLTVNGTYEIEEAFGGGNGKDDLPNGDPNPGANVGFHAYADNATNAQTPKDRADNYGYGSGKASLNIYGGTIHRVFGGSNTKGNVRQTAVTMLEEVGGCDFCVDEAYGGGKSAPMDAEAKLLMACIPGLNAAYGGAEAADIQGNVSLTITNGRFSRVFGGNNLSGTIRGAIKVNVEEVGCKPIIIGELYGGGNEAGYSIYGYKQKTEGGKLVWKPRESASDNTADGECDNLTTPYADPQVNVKSFTSIGAVYGGGYGKTAVMVGNPTVNVSVVEGAWKEYVGESSQYEVEGYVYDATGYKGETITITDSDGTTTHDVELPNHAKGKIGAIGQVFGGGNAAPVKGNTTVNIGTLEKVSVKSYVEKTVDAGDSLEGLGLYTRSGAGTIASPYRYIAATGTAEEGTKYYEEKDVETDVVGVDIRGNVYGGGNNAEVTGNTNVQIGKKM